MNNALCLLDWDGTVRPGYTILDWLLFLNQHNIVDISHVDAFVKSEAAFREGQLHYDMFVHDAANIYARAISGIPRHQIVSMSYDFARIDETRLFSFCRPLLLRLQLANVGAIVISGAPVEPLVAYAARLPITKIFGVQIAVSDDDVYTTTIEHNYGLLQSKIQAVKNIVKDGATVALAIGNSFNDCPLLSVAKRKFFVLESHQPEPITFVHPDDLLDADLIKMI